LFRDEYILNVDYRMHPPGPAPGSSIMGGLLTDFVTIGKAHGATIDHLALGTLALHWAQAAAGGGGGLSGPVKDQDLFSSRNIFPQPQAAFFWVQGGIAFVFRVYPSKETVFNARNFTYFFDASVPLNSFTMSNDHRKLADSCCFYRNYSENGSSAVRLYKPGGGEN